MSTQIIAPDAQIINISDIIGLVIRKGSGGGVTSSLVNGLISFWKFNESSGNASDSYGSNTLTNQNSTAYGTGKVNNAADLTAGSSHHFTRAAQTWGFGNAWSISVWYKQDAGAINRNIIQFGSNLASPGASNFKMESDYLYIANSSGGIFKYWRTFATSADWIHHVLTWDGTTLKLWRNGADYGPSVVKTTDNAGTMADDSRELLIGASKNGGAAGEFFDGLIDAVGLWSRALTAEEVTTLYNSGNGLEHPFV